MRVQVDGTGSPPLHLRRGHSANGRHGCLVSRYLCRDDLRNVPLRQRAVAARHVTRARMSHGGQLFQIDPVRFRGCVAFCVASPRNHSFEGVEGAARLPLPFTRTARRASRQSSDRLRPRRASRARLDPPDGLRINGIAWLVKAGRSSEDVRDSSASLFRSRAVVTDRQGPQHGSAGWLTRCLGRAIVAVPSLPAESAWRLG
jgi:hypothetical protein